MPAYRSVSSAFLATGNGSVTKPAGTVLGDVLVALQYSTGSAAANLSLSGGTSWNIKSSGNTSGGASYKLYAKAAGGSEPASYTSADTGNGAADVIIVCLSDASYDNLVFAVDSAEPSTTVVGTPGVDPFGDADVEIRFAGALTEGTVGTWTLPAGGFTQRAYVSTGLGTVVATRTLASGAATSALNFTDAVAHFADTGVGVTVAVPQGAFPQTVSPSGIASAEAFGTARLNFRIIGQGLASGEAFGNAVVTTPQPQTITPSGIVSGEAFGTLTTRLYLGPSGIATAEAFGAPRLAALIGPAGIASAEAFGLTNVAKEQFITPPGLASGEAFGALTLQIGYPQTITPDGIESGEVVEDPTLILLSRLVLVNPSIQETPVAWNPLMIRYGIHRGITILKDADGVWRSVRYPAQTELESAQRFYLGGRRHVLTVDEAAELTAAGYGEYITLEPND